MTEYVDNVSICNDKTNTPKENETLSLPVSYPKTYHIVVPKRINYTNTYHLIIVFVDVVHE